MARLPIPFDNPHTYPGHSGVDYPKSRGTVFRASGPGTVKTRSSNSKGGFYVWVQYDNGPLVGYHHMDNHNGVPGVGARVQEGSQLGFVGNTGNSTGPHLHSEVAGHATTAGYWQFFDPQRVVGGGGTAGGGSGGGQWSDTKKQQFLVSIGLDTGGVGNGWGPASAAATSTFQTLVGLPVDGVFGPNTTSVAQVIEAGGNRTSRPVAEIQAKVGADADGQWGNKTSLAVYRWQRANGLDADALWGPASDSKAFPSIPQTPPVDGVPAFPLPPHQWYGPEAGGDNSISGWHDPSGQGNPGLKQWQQRMKDRGWPITPDGLYGPKGATTPQGETATVAIAFQNEKGLTPDGLIGPSTWSAAWTAPVTPPGTPSTPVDPVPPTVDEEVAATPDIKTPTAADFPSWIRYEEKFDQQMSADPLWNSKLQDYYGKPYQPIESHTHWWGTPGEAGSHDGNVDYLNRTKDVGANYVVSAGRITLTCPLNKNALTTGARNPYAWKTENDPLITTSVSNHGYKTLGFLHYLVEKLNPSLLNEPIRLHKEFNSTSCSNINVGLVREYADKFASGLLDPATGEPPEIPETPDEGETIEVSREKLEAEYEWLGEVLGKG